MNSAHSLMSEKIKAETNDGYVTMFCRHPFRETRPALVCTLATLELTLALGTAFERVSGWASAVEAADDVDAVVLASTVVVEALVDVVFDRADLDTNKYTRA